MGGEHTLQGAVRTCGLAVLLAAAVIIEPATAQEHDPDCKGQSLVRALPPTAVTPPSKACKKLCHHVCGWACKKSKKKKKKAKNCKHVCKRACKRICVKTCTKPKTAQLSFSVPTTEGRWFLTIRRDRHARAKVRLNGKTLLRSSDFRKTQVRLEITPLLQNALSFSSFKKGELTVQVDGVVPDAELPPELIRHVVHQTLFSQTFQRPQRGGYLWFLCRGKEECVEVATPATEGLFSLTATASRLGSARVRWNGDAAFEVWDFWWRGKSATAPVSLAPTNDLCVRVHGWRGASVTVELSGYVVDAEPPALTVDSPQPGACVGPSGQVALSFSDELSGISPGSLRVELNGVDVTQYFSQSAGSATATLTELPVSEGSNTLVARVRDAACNNTTASVSFVVDTTPPSLSLEPTDGAALTEAQVTLKATFDDGSGCGVDPASLAATLDGEAIQLTAGVGSAQVIRDLPDGTHTFEVRIADLRGNLVTKTSTFTVESGPKIVVPASLSFPEVRVTASVTKSLTISNDSNKAALVVSAAQVTGTAFALDPPFPAQGLTIPPGGSADLTIRFQPQDVGPASGSLVLTSNDTGSPSVTVALAGVGGVGRVELTLSPGPETGLPAGTLHQLKVRAVDSVGNTDTTFTGLIELKTTDPFSPFNDLLVSFTAADQGVFELPALPAFFTAGSHTITARLLRLDGSSPTIGSHAVVVLPAPKGQVYVVVPSGSYQPGNLVTAQVLIDVGPDDRDPLTFDDTLGSYEFRLVFDQRVFQVAAVLGGSSSLGEPMFVSPGKNYVRFQDVNDLGTLQNPLGPDPNATGILEVARIQLLVRADAPRGSTPLFLAVDSLTTGEHPVPQAVGLGDATPRLAERRGQITIDSAAAEATFQLLTTLPMADDNLVSPQQLFRPGAVALFSHDLDPASLAGQVQLLDAQGIAVVGTASTGSPIAVFAPTSPVASGKYKLQILAGIKDSQDRALGIPTDTSVGVGSVNDPQPGDFNADGEITAIDVQRIMADTVAGNPAAVPPIFSGGASGFVTVPEGQTTMLTIRLSDASGGFAGVEPLDMPSFVTGTLVQSAGGETSYVFTFAPGYRDAEPGAKSLTLRATNSQGNSSLTRIQFEIENVSVRPVILPHTPKSPVLSVKETAQPLVFVAWVYDVDRDDEAFKNTIKAETVQVSSVTVVNGSTPVVPLTPSNFTVQYIPPPEEENPGPFTPTGRVAVVRADRTTYDNAGLYMVELSAEDTEGEKATLHYFLEVIDSNRKPTTQVDSPEGLFPLVGKQESVTFTAEDPDGDPLRIALTAAAQQRVNRLVADGVASVSVVEGPFQPGRPSRRTLTVTFTFSGVVDSDGGAANVVLETVAGDGRTVSDLNSARREIGPKGLALRLLARDGHVHSDRVFGRHTIINFMGQFQTWFGLEVSLTNATYRSLAISAAAHPDVGSEAVVPTRGTQLTTVSVTAFYTSLAHNPDLSPFPLKIDVDTEQGPFSTEILVVPLPFRPDDPRPVGPVPVVVNPAQGAAVGAYFDVQVQVPQTGPQVARVELRSLGGASQLGVVSRSVGSSGIDMVFRFRATHDSISMTFRALSGEFGETISQPLNLVREATGSTTPSLVFVRKINGSYERVDPFIIKQGQTFGTTPLSDDNPFVYRVLVDSSLAEPATVAYTVKPGQANPSSLTLTASTLPYRKSSSETTAAGKAYVSPPLVFGYRQIDPPAVSLNPFQSLSGGLGISLPGDPNDTAFPLPTTSSHQIGEVLADAQLSAPGFAQVSAGSTTPRVPGLLFQDSTARGLLEGAKVGDLRARIDVIFPFGGAVTGAPPAAGYQLIVDQGPDSDSTPVILSPTRRETLRFVYDLAEMPVTATFTPGTNRARFFRSGNLEFEATFSVVCQQERGRLLPLRTDDNIEVPKGCDGAFPGQQADTDAPAGDRPYDDGDAPGTFMAGEPGTGATILLATGELRVDRVDIVIPGRAGMDFVFSRRHRTKIHFNGPLGHRWDFNFNEGLYIVPSDSTTSSGTSFKKDDIQRLNGRGRVDTWKIQSDGTYEAPTGHYGTLKKLVDKTFCLRSPNGFKRFYDKEGRLSRYEDRHQNTIHVVYDQDTGNIDFVLDTYGRKIEFTYEELLREKDKPELGKIWRLTSIKDFADREWKYSYNDCGDLEEVTTPTTARFPAGRTEKYQYCEGPLPPPAAEDDQRLIHNLMGIIRPADHGGGTASHTFEFGMDPNEPLTFDRVTKEFLGGTRGGVTAGCTKEYTYSFLNDSVPPGNLEKPRIKVKVVDRNDNASELFANELWHHIKTRDLTRTGEGKGFIRPDEPDSYTTLSFYNSDALLVRRVFPQGNEIRYSYDSQGPRTAQRNVVAITRLADSLRGGGAIITTFGYDPIFNRLTSITDPRAIMPNFAPPIGQRTAGRYTTTMLLDYQEGSPGEILSVASREGVELNEQQANQLSKGKDLNGDRNVGQTAGNVVRTEAPPVLLVTGSELAKLRGSTTQAIVTETVWNRRGQVVKVIDPEGNVAKLEYFSEGDPDGDGEPVPSNSPGPALGGGGYLKATVRDAETSPRRIYQGSPPTALRTEYGYDKVGNVLRVKSPRGVVTLFDVNNLNEILAVVRGADITGVTRLPQGEGAFSYRVEFDHDANGRVTETRTTNTGHEPNPGAGIDNPSAGLGAYVVRTYKYDILDNIVESRITVRQGVELVTRYKYDQNENLIEITKPQGNRVRTEYDERDLPFRITRGYLSSDGDPSTIQIDYDLNGNRRFLIDAEDTDGDGKKEVTTFTYDGFDRLVSVTDPLQNVAVRVYDVASNVVSSLVFGHKPGKPGDSTRVLLSETQYKHDELNRLFQTDERLLDVAKTGFSTSRTTSLTDRNGDGFVSTRVEYDALSRPTFTVEDDGEVTAIAYDGASRAIETRDALGNKILTTYDKNSNPIKVVSVECSAEKLVPDQSFTTINVYDQLNRLARVTDNAGQTTRFKYDSRDNLILRSDAVRGPLQSDPLNLFAGQINGPGNTRRYFYDGLDRQVQVVCDLREGGSGEGQLDVSNPKNSDGMISLRYEWDNNSRLICIVDDNGNKTKFQYDELDRKKAQKNADHKTWLYKYDLDHNVKEITDPNGTEARKTYDALNRLKQVDLTLATGVVGTTQELFQYDGLGRLTRSEDNNGGLSQVCEYAYDSLSRLLEERQNGRAISSVYTGDGKRISCTYPGGRKISNTFDAIDRVQTTSDDSTTPWISTANWIGPGMRELQRLNGNGSTLSFLNDAGNLAEGYDAVKRIKRLRIKPASGPDLLDRRFTYNRADQRTSETREDDSGLTDTYTYDSAYRVTKTQLDTGLGATAKRKIGTLEYTLDGVGNRVAVKKTDQPSPGSTEPPSSVTDAYVPTVMNEYQKVGAVTRVHSGNGNLTDDGTRVFDYDYKNRLVAVWKKTTGQPELIAAYFYFSDNRRAMKRAYQSGALTGEVCFYYDGWQVCEEQNAAGSTLCTFVYSPVYIDEPVQIQRGAVHPLGPGKFFTHQNARADVVGVTDSSGDLVEKRFYDDFGNSVDEAKQPTALSGVGNPYGFQGRRLDPETGLYYFRNRYYDPSTGRFLQRDPVWDPGNYGNQYSFVGNGPASGADPLGFQRPRGRIGVREDKDPELIRALPKKAAEAPALKAGKSEPSFWSRWGPGGSAFRSGGAVDRGLFGGMLKRGEEKGGIAYGVAGFGLALLTITDYLPSPKAAGSRAAKSAWKKALKWFRHGGPRKFVPKGAIRSKTDFLAAISSWGLGKEKQDIAWRLFKEGRKKSRACPTIGRLADTKGKRGILNLADLGLDPKKDWSPRLNDAWIMGAVQAGKKIRLASSITSKNLWAYSKHHKKWAPTVYARELMLLKKHGYVRKGKYLVPRPTKK